MTSLFSTENLNAGRYVSIAISTLPPLTIWGLGSTIWRPTPAAGANVKGIPKPIVFSVVWSILTLLWSFSTIVASFRFDSEYLIILQVFSMITLMCALAWLWQNKKGNKNSAAQILLLTLLFSALMVSTCNNSSSDYEYSNLATSLSITPLPIWLIGASIFSYLEINK
jgi:small-conductance mechanosensitive channel